jgi:hypothetical protein
MKARKAGMTRAVSLVGVSMIAIACGGSSKQAAPPASASASTTSAVPADSAAPSAAAAATATGGPAPAPSSSTTATSQPAAAPAPATPPPPEHPFASTADQATSLIDDAITSRANELGECVEAARARRKSPHAKLVIEVGIDEEGHMLGVKLPKAEKADKGFTDCVLAALKGAPFPKSHAGVITVRKTFEDKAVYR